MYKVDGTHITMTRGDTVLIQVQITTPEGEPYTPVEGDKVRFALKPSDMTGGGKQFKARSPIVLKQIPISTMILQLEPDDTSGYDFGEYKYDIEITQANGIVTTFIANADLTLAPEVH